MRLFGGVRYIDRPSPDNIRRLDHNALPMVSWMHSTGIRVDVPFLHSLTQRIVTRQLDLKSQVSTLIGDYQYLHAKNGLEPFKISSRDHIAQLLFEYLEVQGRSPVGRTKSGKRFSADDDTLQQFSTRHPVVPLIQEWFELDKLRSFTVALPTMTVDSRIHTSFNPVAAATGRFSSRNPNLQQIPVRSELGRQIRNAFIASPGCFFVSNDLSQIEMRWAAHGSQDPTMMEIFHLGQDIHARNACEIFGRDYDDVMSWDHESAAWKTWKAEERAPTKNLGFGVLYGLQAPGLRRNILTESEGKVDWSEERCTEFIDKFFTVYPKLKGFMELQYNRARRYSLVWDAFGRVRLIPECKSFFRQIRAEGERKAGNHYEQASSAGSMKLAMAGLTEPMRELDRDFVCRPLLTIHDQLISEVDKDHAEEFGWIAQSVMEHAAPLTVPVLSSMELGERWGDM